ncbi:hypothetical protein BDD12DRAFT_838732 [Trichophaea hybrida]|nr:hypothetical protein BDD12DRAFT_838732 [Trichophaea hybrida]
MDSGFVRSFQAESWTLYGVAVVFFGLRLFTRIHFLGVKKDDFVMCLCFTAYTTLIICLNLIIIGGGSNLFLPEQFATFTSAEIKERIKGSKIVLVSEQAMLITIWSAKACMLLFYSVLTTGLHAKRVVKGVAIYVGCGFIACELTFFFACRPFSGYWAVPPPDSQCTTFVHYAIVNAVFNISSDIMMMGIPLPLLVASRLPTKHKIAVCGVFLMGVFVIVAAILTKVFNLSNVYSTEYMKWYTREASVAVFVSNIPLIWPLIRRVIPGMGSVNSKSYSGARTRIAMGDVEMSTSKMSSRMKKEKDWESESRERIVDEGGIRQEITVSVESEKAGAGAAWEEAINQKFGAEGSQVEYSIKIESQNKNNVSI